MWENDEDMLKREAKMKFIKQRIEFGLKDYNTGFDVASISYFSLKDFYKILERCKQMDIGVFGIEPWPNGEFGDVKTKEDYNTHSKDETWWYAAIDSMVEAGIDHNYSCSYDVPEKCYWPIKED